MRAALLLGLALVVGCAPVANGDDDDSGDEPPTESGPTWTNFAEDFFATYCTSCHSPAGQASADFGEYDVVTQRLNAIRCGVAPEEQEGCEGEHPPGWFPIGNGPFPTDDERWTLVEWIEAEAPF